MSNVKIEFHFRGYYSHKKIKPTFGQFVGFSVSTDRNYDDNYSDIAVIAYEGPIESFNHGIEVIIKPFIDKVDLLKSIKDEYQEEYFLFIETDINEIVFKKEHQKFFDDINCNIQFNPWWKSYWPDTMYKCLQKHFERGAAILVEDIISFYGKDIADDYIPLMIEKGYIKEFAKDVYYLPFRQNIDGIMDFTFPIDGFKDKDFELPDYSIDIVKDIIVRRFTHEDGKRIGFFRAFRMTDDIYIFENFIYTNKKFDYDSIDLGGRKFNIYHSEKEINEDNYKDMFLEEIKKRKPKSIWDY